VPDPTFFLYFAQGCVFRVFVGFCHAFWEIPPPIAENEEPLAKIIFNDATGSNDTIKIRGEVPEKSGRVGTLNPEGAFIRV